MPLSNTSQLVSALNHNVQPAVALGVVDQYPHQEWFQFSNGQKVYLPVHLLDYDCFFILGKADIGALNQVLAPEDLTADEWPEDSGHGVVTIFFNDIRRGDAEAYREVLVTITATSSFPAKKGLYAWHVRVTGAVGLRYGREVWGYPKEFAEIDFARVGDDFRSHYVQTNGTSAMEVTCGNVYAQPLKKASRDYTIVTPYSIRRSWAAAFVEGGFSDGRRFPDAAAGDSFTLNPHSELGGLLNGLGFDPQWLACGLGLSAVGLR